MIHPLFSIHTYLLSRFATFSSSLKYVLLTIRKILNAENTRRSAIRIGDVKAFLHSLKYNSHQTSPSISSRYSYRKTSSNCGVTGNHSASGISFMNKTNNHISLLLFFGKKDILFSKRFQLFKTNGCFEHMPVQ